MSNDQEPQDLQAELLAQKDLTLQAVHLGLQASGVALKISDAFDEMRVWLIEEGQRAAMSAYAASRNPVTTYGEEEKLVARAQAMVDACKFLDALGSDIDRLVSEVFS